MHSVRFASGRILQPRSGRIGFHAPGPIHIDNHPRLFDLTKGLESLAQDGCLLIDVARLAQRMAKRPRQENRSRRFYLFCITAYQGYADRRDADCLDGTLDQSDGLIANASGRSEQHGVHPVLLEHTGHSGRGFAYQSIDMGPLNMAHKAEMPLGQ
jgi:hypothetical protein